jgi:hypothetical protein
VAPQSLKAAPRRTPGIHGRQLFLAPRCGLCMAGAPMPGRYMLLVMTLRITWLVWNYICSAILRRCRWGLYVQIVSSVVYPMIVGSHLG